MEFVDTHAHLYLDRFDDDRDAVFDRAFDAGVTTIVLPAIDIASIHAALELSARYKGVYAMAALHPSETRDADDRAFEQVAELARESGIVAIGETGLDYYWDRSFDARQQDFARRHIRLAHDLNLPVVFHNREATADLMAIVRSEQEKVEDPTRLRGIFHCFSGSREEADEITGLGFHLGIGGNVTFKKSTVAESIRELALRHIVLETDAPFLTPAPNRGKRNESSYVPHIASFLADHRGVPVDEIARVTTASALALFGL